MCLHPLNVCVCTLECTCACLRAYSLARARAAPCVPGAPCVPFWHAYACFCEPLVALSRGFFCSARAERGCRFPASLFLGGCPCAGARIVDGLWPGGRWPRVASSPCLLGCSPLTAHAAALHFWGEPTAALGAASHDSVGPLVDIKKPGKKKKKKTSRKRAVKSPEDALLGDDGTVDVRGCPRVVCLLMGLSPWLLLLVLLVASSVSAGQTLCDGMRGEFVPVVALYVWWCSGLRARRRLSRTTSAATPAYKG
jgi:hypothetical protein